MTYTAHTAASFKERFPAFADVADTVINASLGRARTYVTDAWMAQDRAEGEALWAAHEMTLDGLGATREAQLTGFKRLKLGSLELERETTGNVTGYRATTYGERFQQLMRRNLSPMLVATKT